MRFFIFSLMFIFSLSGLSQIKSEAYGGEFIDENYFKVTKGQEHGNHNIEVTLVSKKRKLFSTDLEFSAKIQGLTNGKKYIFIYRLKACSDDVCEIQVVGETNEYGLFTIKRRYLKGKGVLISSLATTPERLWINPPH